MKYRYKEAVSAADFLLDEIKKLISDKHYYEFKAILDAYEHKIASLENDLDHYIASYMKQKYRDCDE